MLVLRSDENSLVCLPSGDIDADVEAAAGLYYRDTRHLSKLTVSFAGVTPVLLDARETEHGISAISCNPTVTDGSGNVIPSQSLTMRRRRVLVERLVESLSISNYGARAIDAEVRIDFGADFHDIFEVRGYQRTGTRPTVQVERGPAEVRFRYIGADGVERTTTIRFRPEPWKVDENSATYLFSLAPRETATIEFEASPRQESSELSFSAATEMVRSRQRSWLAGMTRLETDDERVNALLRRSLLDLEALRGMQQGEQYIAAGVPWFDTLFGRDSLLTGIELLAFDAKILGWALRLLARNQATDTDAAREAEPGKIPHELRWGELAGAGEVPFARYYGSVDATPLFILGAREYVRWTNDLSLARELWPQLQAAVKWCTESPSVDRDGFLRYARETAAGLENQGWKDSRDALIWPDGALVRPPIALVEVQAYLVAALRAFAELASLLQVPPGDTARRGEDVRQRFDERFGHPELGYVFALDGDGQPVPTPVSNSGHVLWARSASRAGAHRVGDSLLSHDLFSGWGVRTLGTSTFSYNPLSYHRGSVWPHDNALAVAGLRNYGLDEQAAELADALLEAALTFPAYRLPELFSGDSREYRAVPTPYPVASRPQAWSAAAIPYVLMTMLGLHANGPEHLTIVRPLLPRGVTEARVSNLRLPGGSVDLTFRRGQAGVSVEVGKIEGILEVSLVQARPLGEGS